VAGIIAPSLKKLMTVALNLNKCAHFLGIKRTLKITIEMLKKKVTVRRPLFKMSIVKITKIQSL
jgi:hypothetical protein